jgi:hypothetical protein
MKGERVSLRKNSCTGFLAYGARAITEGKAKYKPLVLLLPRKLLNHSNSGLLGVLSRLVPPLGL